MCNARSTQTFNDMATTSAQKKNRLLFVNMYHTMHVDAILNAFLVHTRTSRRLTCSFKKRKYRALPDYVLLISAYSLAKATG